MDRLSAGFGSILVGPTVSGFVLLAGFVAVVAAFTTGAVVVPAQTGARGKTRANRTMPRRR